MVICQETKMESLPFQWLSPVKLVGKARIKILISEIYDISGWGIVAVMAAYMQRNTHCLEAISFACHSDNVNFE